MDFNSAIWWRVNLLWGRGIKEGVSIYFLVVIFLHMPPYPNSRPRTGTVPLIVLIHCIIPYNGLFLCDIQVCVLQMEINQASGDQSVWHHNGHSF